MRVLRHDTPASRRRLVPLALTVALAVLVCAPAGRAQAAVDTVRPVILVHGLTSSAATWDAYTRPGGFLESVGRRGYAVGDGQAPGVLETGRLGEPRRRTNTIAENAAVLADYIAGVRELTGAAYVDIVAHSMGGLISRYYVDRLMRRRDVARLIMLGTPNVGSDCARLPAALGFAVPATLELRPLYVREVFNRQVSRQRGVPFHVLAGTPITDPIQGFCTGVPSDLVVSLASASGVAAALSEQPVAHLDMTGSAAIFTTFVHPLLTEPGDELPVAADAPLVGDTTPQLQFTGVFAGVVAPGDSIEHVIELDAVTVASFAVYDPSRSLSVTVRGAAGAVIELDPTTHGLLVVDDPETLVRLGYGFRNPRPGPWRVTLTAAAGAPPDGAEYAISAQLHGGAVLTALVGELQPRLDAEVPLSARLELGGQPLPIDEATAVVRRPDGSVESYRLEREGDGMATLWRPAVPGLHAIDIAVTTRAPDGTPIHRAAFLAAEVQPPPAAMMANRLVAGAALAGVLIALASAIAAWRRRRAAASASRS